MALNDNKRTTIVRQHIKRLIIAIVAGALVFCVLYQATGTFMDRYLEQTGYYKSHELKYVHSLQEYAQQHKVSSEDDELLTAWGNEQDDIFFQIYDESELLYQFYSRNSKSFQEAASLNYLEWVSPYLIQLSDGDFQVIFFGDYYYNTFKYLMIVDVLGAFAVFLIIFLTGIRKRTRYITQLRDEIEILGGGDLDYEVTVQGSDELTDLAENLNQMRQALKEHIEGESRLVAERQTIMTQLSHDIRTPLTSMNLFADLLKKGKYQDEEQREHYLNRIQENAANLTNLAEELFNVSREAGQSAPKDQVGNDEVEYGQTAPDAIRTYEKAEELQMNDSSSDNEHGYSPIRFLVNEAESLRLSGFMVEERYSSSDQNVLTDRNAFERVLYNISSNILRYADPCESVQFVCDEDNDAVVIAFKNKKCPPNESEISEGSGIGLTNIRELMQKQGGSVQIEDGDTYFLIRLIFPKKPERL